MKKPDHTTETYSFDTINDALDFIQGKKRAKGLKVIELTAPDNMPSSVTLSFVPDSDG